MSPEGCLQRLGPIVRKVFADDTLVVTESLSMDAIPSWDSISHMALITATEQAFEIRFSLVELVAVASIGDLLVLIQTKKGDSK
ncbi:MAG: acyl carrier protein [Nitrospirae bacterium]|nr:acyl carrier protein [Magnetococcales bacterium]HAT48811.1 acyl carrier protein [Alphaproteobacteria bacterium]